MPAEDQASRAERQAVNLARHLDERHPDTVLFLARSCDGHAEATSAELLAVADAGVTLSTDLSAEPVHLPFDTSPGQPADPRGRFRRLLETARSQRPDEPLTSLEQQLLAADHPHGH